MSSDHPDLPSVHAHFATTCFNEAWTLMDQPTRTVEQDEQMLLLATASLWHWTQRADCTDRHRSVGHWQVSRVQGMLGHLDAARWHAQQCLVYAEHLTPFYIGFGHEALARVAKRAGSAHAAEFESHLAAARELLDFVADDEERTALQRDLDELAADL
jgi:hypothetical protein